MTPNSIERLALLANIKDKTFFDAVQDNDFEAVDSFLLLRSEFTELPDYLDIFKTDCIVKVSKMLKSEQIGLKNLNGEI